MKAALVLLLMTALTAAAQQDKNAAAPSLAELRRMTARFAPTPLKVAVSSLSAGDRRALPSLIEAARLFNTLYMEQLWSGNLALYRKLQQDKSALGRARLHYFWINKGPWSELDEFRAFLPGVPARKPLGANFYPPGLSKDAFEQWLKTLPAGRQEQARGFFTVVRGGTGGALNLVPYSQQYRAQLEKAAALLRQAAAATDNPSLRKFLASRAAAFLSDDYFQSDVDWMDLDAPIDVTIGPYETYTDELFGYKAAFEAYVHLRDDRESARLGAISRHLQDIENNLPLDPRYRNPRLGAAAPIRVVNEIIAGGDGEHAVQTAAYNLPNDERVLQQKGAKRVMMKNVQEAKFNAILLPISQIVLAPAAQKDVSFESFFTHIVAHELTHGLGPHQITVSGRQTSPRQELKELYSAIEEAKADVTGLFALQYLMDQGSEIVPRGPDVERRLYTTFLASVFRTLRFGAGDAHGRGMVMQMNYLLEHGGFVAHPDGTFAVDFAKIKEAVRSLDREFLMIEATGDYAAAKKLQQQHSAVRPEVQRAIARLTHIPVDIEPRFVTADQLAPKK